MYVYICIFCVFICLSERDRNLSELVLRVDQIQQNKLKAPPRHRNCFERTAPKRTKECENSGYSKSLAIVTMRCAASEGRGGEKVGEAAI